ncbi:MAG: phosphotransferase, partial [Chloroflexi bacterium]|nr:phosphotransferase [Chloroflexota bacterium]
MKWLALGEQLATLPQDKDCFGLIHNDLHQYNFFVSRTADGEVRLTLFDFDVCNYHFFMTDIGIAVFHALWEGRPQEQSAEAFATRFLEHFMRGYCRENSLEDAWLKRLPMFLK